MEVAMSIEGITEKIVSEANAFAAEVLSKAEAEAKSIAEEYESTANKEFDQIVDAAYEKAREIMNRADAQSMKEKRIGLLSVKWEYLDNAFSTAVRMLGQKSDDDQVRLMSALVKLYQRSDAELIMNEADRKRIGQKVVSAINAVSADSAGIADNADSVDGVGSVYSVDSVNGAGSVDSAAGSAGAGSGVYKITLSERTGDFSGGLVLKEGGIETNLSYDALVMSRREQLEDDVVSILFGED